MFSLFLIGSLACVAISASLPGNGTVNDEVSVKPLPGLTPMLLGEGPHWSEKHQSLLFVDISAGTYFRYYTQTGRIQKLKIDDDGYGSFTSIIVPVKNSSSEFLIAIGKTLALVNWSEDDPDFVLKNATEFVTVEKDAHLRFNDGKCDPRGRFWAGTMAYEHPAGVFAEGLGTLFRLDNDLKIEKKLENLSIPNGLAWSSDKKKFYYIDSADKHVGVYDYDDTTGNISNKKVLFDYEKNGLMDQVPDGMTIDEEDNLWVACWGGHQVIRINGRTGKLMQSVKLPSKQISSCCFGGKDYSTLYVTSAINGLPRSELLENPHSGLVFEVTGLGIRGVTPNEFQFNRTKLKV